MPGGFSPEIQVMFLVMENLWKINGESMVNMWFNGLMFGLVYGLMND